MTTHDSLTRSADELANAAREIKGTTLQTDTPGWHISIEPFVFCDGDQQRVLVYSADTEGPAIALPRDCEQGLMIVSGIVTLHRFEQSMVEEPIAQLNAAWQNQRMYLIPRGKRVAMRALTRPSKVLCVCYREDDARHDGATA